MSNDRSMLNGVNDAEDNAVTSSQLISSIEMPRFKEEAIRSVYLSRSPFGLFLCHGMSTILTNIILTREIEKKRLKQMKHEAQSSKCQSFTVLHSTFYQSTLIHATSPLQFGQTHIKLFQFYYQTWH